MGSDITVLQSKLASYFVLGNRFTISDRNFRNFQNFVGSEKYMFSKLVFFNIKYINFVLKNIKSILFFI